MTRITVFLLLLAVVRSTASIAQALPPTTGPAQLPSADLPRDLMRLLKDYEDAWHSRDAKKLAGLFTEDGFVLSPLQPPVRGREAIQQHYAHAGGPLSLRALAYATDGRIGYIIGGFSQNRDDPDTGKFTLILRKAHGRRWLIVADMDNGNRRP